MTTTELSPLSVAGAASHRAPDFRAQGRGGNALLRGVGDRDQPAPPDDGLFYMALSEFLEQRVDALVAAR